MSNDIESCLEAIEAALDTAFENIVKEGDDYWRFHMKENAKREIKNSSILGFRARRRKNSISAEWYWNRWKKNKNGKTLTLSHHIGKGRGDRYPESVLMHYAKDWEIGRVLDIESRLAVQRRMVKCLKKAEVSLRAAQRAQEQVGTESELDDAADE